METYLVDPKVLPCVEDYLHAQPHSKIYTWDNFSPDVVLESTHIIYVQQPPPFHDSIRGMKISLLNIEQLTRKRARDWLLHSLGRCSGIQKVIDYSPANLSILNDILKAHDVEVRPFPAVTPPQPYIQIPMSQVAFVGAMSPRRKRILDGLEEKGVIVKRITSWGKDRDRMIAQCSVLINIHFADDYRIFESFRCAPWAIHPHIEIVSEESLLQEQEWMYPYVHWASYDKLVQTVQNVLQAQKGIRTQF